MPTDTESTVKQAVVAISFWARPFRMLTTILNDALYRGSLTLLTNTLASAIIGFLFWTFAARSYPASTVGVFSGVTSGVSLLAAVAALGLPNTMIRHVSGAENSRELVVVAATAIATVGTALCLVSVIILGPHLPPALHLQQRGRMMLLVTGLVTVTAVSGTLDAGLVATRSSHVVLIKNLVGSTVKVGALFLLVSLRSSGLVISYGLGLVVAALLSGVALSRRLAGPRVRFRSFTMLSSYLSFTSRNYLATIMGIMPVSVVPLEVLAARGAAQTARFAVAFLIATSLNLIPATVAQVLFAEASRQGVALGRQLRKALRGVYGLLLPALAITVAAAPLLLRLFGAAYAKEATDCLRILALSTLLTGGTYLVDSLLIARDRTTAYIFMNAANAALVLGCVGILASRGLTATALGWTLGQGMSLVLGLLILATGTVGRHHLRISPDSPNQALQSSSAEPGPPSASYELQIRELLATWPMIPTTLIAQRIGWDQSFQLLLDQVTEMRLGYLRPDQRGSQVSHLAGELAQCGLWFPSIQVPVGFGQVRSARQLPVLTMITGHSRWISAMLIPSGHPNDLYTALWELLVAMGSTPQVLTWDNNPAVGRREAGIMSLTQESTRFSRALGTRMVIGEPGDSRTRDLIECAHLYLERSFLPHRTFASPADFNAQLLNWLNVDNTRARKLPNLSPADLIDTDRRAMLPLPQVPPPTGWHLQAQVGDRPFLRFDANYYSVNPTIIGHRTELMADLRKVQVVCEGKITASHLRSWAREATICGPSNPTATRLSGRA